MSTIKPTSSTQRKSKVANGDNLYQRIREILESARTGVARTVNSTQTMANWLIGRELIQEEQSGAKRAVYGKRTLEEVAARLSADFGTGYSMQNLRYMRQFYQMYPEFVDESGIRHTLRGEFTTSEITPKNRAWAPGRWSPNLSWSHYRTLLRVESPHVRAFYEIETDKNNWTARELERQIDSLLFERLAKSKDKKGLMKLASKGQQIATPADVFKDPVVIEFLGLPESPRLVESDLETALVDNLQSFLLELGKGFAFVARQRRLTLDGDHFYVDLVFYHTILKCHVLIDLKVGKLTHADLGQMQLYVNYYDRECRTEGDGPTLGLILCTGKNDAVVKYLLGPEQSKKIFASRYKLHLPTEADLIKELKRELKELR